jgi:DNA primase
VITEEDKERVRQATDILALVGETVELRQRGADWWGCCPFHHEKSPSFHVNPSTGLWNCFGCHKGGDVFDYVMAREHLEFPDAIRYLADRAGLELVEERGTNHGPKRNRLMQTLAEAEAYYSLMLLRGRGEGPSSARHY